jgi:hypothetical protein
MLHLYLIRWDFVASGLSYALSSVGTNVRHLELRHHYNDSIFNPLPLFIRGGKFKHNTGLLFRKRPRGKKFHAIPLLYKTA